MMTMTVMKSCPWGQDTCEWGPSELTGYKVVDKVSVRTGASSRIDGLKSRILMLTKLFYASGTLNYISFNLHIYLSKLLLNPLFTSEYRKFGEVR